MSTLRVSSIYPAFMGEVSMFGIGAKCTFLRLSGCNLRCYKKTKGVLCDTPEALDCKMGSEMSIEEILLNLRGYGNTLVCLTGGEPLMQDVLDLLVTLSNSGYNVVVETNGSKDISPYRHIKNVSFVIDYKGKSTGETHKMFKGNYSLMDGSDFIKFVVDDENDYIEVQEWILNNPLFRGNIAVGTFWGSKIGYQELIMDLIVDRLPVVLNMQTHKMCVMYDKYKDTTMDLVIPKEL